MDATSAVEDASTGAVNSELSGVHWLGGVDGRRVGAGRRRVGVGGRRVA